MLLTGTIPPEAMRDLLLHVARLLEPVTWLYDGGYHFRLPVDGWTVSFSPDSAGRVRVEACRGTVPVSTVWVALDDRDRLTAIVEDLREQAAAVVGSI